MLVKYIIIQVLKAYKQAVQYYKKELEDWETYGQAKIVLAVENLEKLSSFYEKAKKLGVNCCTIKDAGRTQVEPGTLTCCAIGPGKVSVIDNITGSLSLL
jgi:PTH2 family peptidyl-tRNA hydrolase